MPIANPPSGTVTLLFTDIEGSTRLWESHPSAMRAALSTHDQVLREIIEGRRGYVFYRAGDAFGAAFSAPGDALAAATAIQQKLPRASWPPEIGALRVRIGLHTGQLEESDGDYLGPPVNRVARLMAAGHGGQILLSLATEELVRNGLPDEIGLTDLGKHRLKDLSKPETIFQVTAPDIETDFPDLITLDFKRTNLPAQATPFVGRQRESAALTDLLSRDDVRLVTLTGPGGIGKTRLSLQVAADLLDGYEDGAFFVNLAPIANSDRVGTVIAGTLGVTSASEANSLDDLRRVIAKKNMLLVLDNFEHVIDAAPLIAELIAAAPDLKIMTSSREVLRIYGEHEFPVPPLGLPELARSQTAAAISEFEAVSLFLQRARAAQPSFEIDEANAATIAEICRRLEGMPLAIELAAARVRMFDAPTLLERLSDSLKTLTGGPRDLPGRQQTIRGAIEWSYDLLDEDERALFARLGVFRGGRSGEAVEAVCGPSLGIDPWDGLESLLLKSLLRRDDGPGEGLRFVMLETIQAYAGERLAEIDEVDEVRGRHAEFFAYLAELADAELEGPNHGLWVKRLAVDYENFREAMTWGLAGGNVEVGLRIVAALGRYWSHRDHLEEGMLWLRRGLELVDQAPDAVHAEILENATGFVYIDDLAESTRMYEEAMVIRRRLGDRSAIARLLINSWVTSADDEVFLQNAREGLALAREIGDQNEVWHGLANVGEGYHSRGEYRAAEDSFEEALLIARQLGNIFLEAQILSPLGLVAVDLDRPAVAKARFLDSFKLWLEIVPDQLDMAPHLVFGGAILSALGEPERGIRVLAAGSIQQAAIGWQTRRDDQRILDRLMALTHHQVDDKTFNRLWVEGEALSLEEAIELRLRED